MSSKSPGRKKKLIIYKVLMLDDQEVPFQLEQKTIGLDLLNLVYQYLKLIESDYFSLIYIDSKGKKCWLDYDKAVTKQITPETRLIFCVKFYTPDPGQLEEEYTRYLYALQIKKDLSDGLLLCSDATASLLASYILQAEIGDYNENHENNPNYFQNQKYFPHQNSDHELKIMDYHKNHIGQSPADADLNLLDIARKVELYGIIMHPAKDHEGVILNLAVAHMGILVFQNYTKINTFSWAKIRKLSFKRRKFLIKLHPENFGFYKDTVEFYLDNRDDSKNFWKECIEHHSFFRCVSSRKNINKNNKSKLLTRGSSFKYYGRTQKEVIENARESFPKNRTFERTYNSMKSINNIANESTVSNSRDFAQISGTQSLNRNLGGRNNNTANSASQSPRIIHTSRSIQPNIVKSTTLRSNDTTTTCNSNVINTTPTTPAISLVGIDARLNDYDDDNNDDDLIANKVKEKKQQNNEDASTQGSRTIDSRYSRDRMLAGHDDDDDEDYDDNQSDKEKDEDNIIKTSSFAKLPKFKQHEKLKINIEQINNALKKEFELNSTPKSPPATQVTISQPAPAVSDKQINELTAQKPQSSPFKANLSTGTASPSAGNNVNNNINNSSNMNKIYSRKEVITIKEETKNIYNEEYTSQQLIYQPSTSNNYFPTVHDTQNERLKFYNSYDKITQQQSIQESLQQQQTTTTPTNSKIKRSSFSSSPMKPTVNAPASQNKQNKINIDIDNDDVDDEDDDDYVYDGKNYNFNTFNNNNSSSSKTNLNAILIPIIRFPSLVGDNNCTDLFKSSSSLTTSYTSNSTSRNSLSILSSSIYFSSSASLSSSSLPKSSSSSSSISSTLNNQQIEELKPQNAENNLEIKPKNLISKTSFKNIKKECKTKFKAQSLPRFRKYIELIDVNKLPSVNATSYHDDTIQDKYESNSKYTAWIKISSQMKPKVDDYEDVISRLNLFIDADRIKLSKNNYDDDDNKPNDDKQVEDKLSNLNDENNDNSRAKYVNNNSDNEVSTISSPSSLMLSSPTVYIHKESEL